MLRRRMMMLGREENDEWDIKLYPDENGQIKGIAVVPPDTAKGFLIKVNITKSYNGYVYDARNTLNDNFAANSYIQNLTSGEHILDRSTLFAEKGVVGSGRELAVGCKGNSLKESCYAEYLYLKWVY